MPENNTQSPQSVGLTAPEKLNAEHDLSDFDCGNEPINTFARKALKHQYDRNCNVFVVCETGTHKVRGFFTLSNASIVRNELPAAEFKNAFQSIPATLLGQLAVDLRYQKKGIGLDLLKSAILAAIDASINNTASRALLVHATSSAIEFYRKAGFAHTISLFPAPSDEHSSMYISLTASALQLLKDQPPCTPPD